MLFLRHKFKSSLPYIVKTLLYNCRTSLLKNSLVDVIMDSFENGLFIEWMTNLGFHDFFFDQFGNECIVET